MAAQMTYHTKQNQQKFRAEKIYHFLSSNAVPLQNSSFTNLLQRTPTQNQISSPKIYVAPQPNYFSSRMNKTPSPNHGQLISYQQNVLPPSSAPNRSFDIPKVMVDKAVQVSFDSITVETQTDFLSPPQPHSQPFQQPNIKIQPPESFAFEAQKVDSDAENYSDEKSDRFSELIKMRREIQSHQSQQNPRQATSMWNEVQAMERESLQRFESHSLLQIVFLKDPYAFKELSDMVEQDDINKFVTNISKQIEHEIKDLDQGNLNHHKQIASRAKLKLKKFKEVLNKIVDVFDQFEDEDVMEQKDQNNIQQFFDDIMKDIQLQGYAPEILTTFEGRAKSSTLQDERLEVQQEPHLKTDFSHLSNEEHLQEFSNFTKKQKKIIYFLLDQKKSIKTICKLISRIHFKRFNCQINISLGKQISELRDVLKND